MFMHFSCIRTFNSLYSDIDLCWYFSTYISLSLSLSLSLSPLLWLVCSMAPKKASLFRPKTLLIPRHLPLILPPSYVRFRDDKAYKDFSEYFSRCGIHSECQVVLSKFSDTDLPTVIYSGGWESLCGILVTCPSMII